MVNSHDYEISYPAEPLAAYGDGGLHPVSINDMFDGRYEILNKLGFGQLATVWIARDHVKSINVALKVVRADHSEDNQELRILQHIQTNAIDHPGHIYLPRLLNHFYQGAFRRKNLFLVLELLGPSIRAIMARKSRQRFSPSWSRTISRQLHLAVHCLHSVGISHGDVYEENILLHLPNNSHLDFSKVIRGEISRKDGAPREEGVPEYLVAPLELESQLKTVKLEEFDCIQLIDFSSSFFDSEPPKLLYTPAHVSPPELIFEKPLSKSVDIWSLACMTFYCAVNAFLFDTSDGAYNIIPQIHRTLGESSAHWLLTAIFDANDSVWRDKIPRFSGYKGQHILEEALLEACRYGKDEISDADVEQLRLLGRYLRKALRVDPLKRATIEELLLEDWIQVEIS